MNSNCSWSDDWAATADLTTLRQHLLVYYVNLPIKRVTSFSLQGSAVLTTSMEAGNPPPSGALAIGRILLSQLPTDVQAVAGLTLGADPIVSAVSFCL